MAKIGLLCFWAAALSFAPVCAMAQTGLPADDSRLDARVTVSHPVATIETFLDDLSGRIGVRLKADVAVKDDLIILRVKDVPARELMERVSKHFDWSWSAEDGGYVLYQSKEQKEREEKAYKEQYVEPLRRAQAEAARLLQEAEGKEGELRRQYREMERLLADPGLSPEERGELWWARERLKAQSTAVGRLALKLLTAMTFEQFRELHEVGVLVYAITPNAAQHSMGDAVPLGREAMQEVLAEAGLAEGSGTELLLWFSSDGGLWPDTRSDAHVSIVGAGGQEIAHEYVLIPVVHGASGGVASTLLSGRRLSSPLVEELLRAFDGAPTRNAAVELSLKWFLPGTSTMPQQGHTELAVAIVEELGFNLLTDLRDGPWWGDAMRSRDAGLLLDFLYPRGWRLDGNWVTARSPQWALRRASSIPVDQERQIRDAYFRNGGFSLDEAGQLAARYSDDQILNSIGPYFVRPALRPALAALRFLHSLGTPLRQMHENGAPVPVVRLSPVQRRLARRVMLSNVTFGPERYGEYRYDFNRRRNISPAIMTELMPVGVPGDAEVVLVSSEGLAVQRQAVTPDGKPTGLLYTEPASTFALQAAFREREVPSALRHLVRTATQEMYLVVIHFGDLRIGSAEVSLFRWDPNAPFVSADQLPEQVKRAIEEARRRREGGGGATS